MGSLEDIVDTSNAYMTGVRKKVYLNFFTIFAKKVEMNIGI
jgi:hypothetical protein